MNAIDLIRAHHVEIDALFAEALDAADDRRADLLRELGDRFEVHATVEETIFYPTFATGDATAVLKQYAHDHQRIRRELAEIVGRPLDVTREVIAAVHHTFRRHAFEQEGDHLLPLVERTLTGEQLEELGTDMQALYDELLQRGAWRALDADSHHARI
jgi:hypothetical protein